MDDDLITRGEVEGLLFNVADIAAVLTRFEKQFEEDDGGEEGDEG